MTGRGETGLFGGLPDSARLWIFGVGRSLSGEEEARLLGSVAAFLGGWKAHGRPLAALHEWVGGRFLLVAVDDRTVSPSGCSIDALVGRLRALEAEFGTEIVGGAPVWYRSGGTGGVIERVSRPVFRDRARAGLVTGETVVFDLSLERVGELRLGHFERLARESWHRRYLAPRAPEAAPRR